VLVTMDRDGGNGGYCWEGYWWFDRSGPHPLDFSPLRAAIQEKLPEDSVLLGMTCDSLDFKSGRVRGVVQKSGAECRAAGTWARCLRISGSAARLCSQWQSASSQSPVASDFQRYAKRLEGA
jgi:hypothetical protein